MIENGAEGFSSEIADLAEQLSQIAKDLLGVASHGEIAHERQNTQATAGPTLLERAERLYADRRQRSPLIGGYELFGEPAWDILLDLYIAHARGKVVSVSSACIGSAAPPTTGLRWLGILQQEGLVLRENDPQDQRRVNVRLSPDAITRLETYLSGLTDKSGKQ
ncbi:hypothetical protein [Altererythrobacter epoxidivorans]|nr:hypothetical protein [Altererythrobacter epoxidivorans]